jgi:hypothetical protein
MYGAAFSARVNSPAWITAGVADLAGLREGGDAARDEEHGYLAGQQNREQPRGYEGRIALFSQALGSPWVPARHASTTSGQAEANIYLYEYS